MAKDSRQSPSWFKATLEPSDYEQKTFKLTFNFFPLASLPVRFASSMTSTRLDQNCFWNFIDINSIILSVSLNWADAKAKLFHLLECSRHSAGSKAIRSVVWEIKALKSTQSLTYRSDLGCDDRVTCWDRSQGKTRAVAEAECRGAAPTPCQTSAWTDAMRRCCAKKGK